MSIQNHKLIRKQHPLRRRLNDSVDGAGGSGELRKCSASQSRKTAPALCLVRADPWEKPGQGHENFSLNANVLQFFLKKKICLPFHLSHKGQQRSRNTNLTHVSQMQDSVAFPALLPSSRTISNTRRKWTLA